MDAQAAQQALQRVALSIYRRVPRPFAEAGVRYRSAGTVSAHDGWIRPRVGGDRQFLDLDPDDDFAFGMRDLRAATYQDGKGAWFTAEISVTGEGRFEARYDYDSRPEFSIELVPSTFADDLQRFPRAEQHQPQWLKDELAASSR